MSLADFEDTAAAYWEFNALFKDVFVKFYRSNNTIYQVCLDGSGYYRAKHENSWKFFIGNPPENAEILDRVVAEMLEDEWNDEEKDNMPDFYDNMDWKK